MFVVGEKVIVDMSDFRTQTLSIGPGATATGTIIQVMNGSPIRYQICLDVRLPGVRQVIVTQDRLQSP